MKKLIVWIMAGVLMLAAFYGLAENSLTPTQATQESKAFQVGDEGEQVTAIQKRLAELFYISGEASGIYDEATQSAIREFQTDYGMEDTGITDSATLEKLQAARFRALEKGDSGEDVKALQTRLTELEYYFGKISGNYLDGSFSAIESFQKKNGLEATGKADIATLELLFDAEKALGKYATATPPPVQAATPTPSPTSTAAPSPQASGASPTETPAPAPTGVAFTKQLKKGSSGEKVELLQQRLANLGYFTEPVTGSYSSSTKDAVAAFQKNNNLTSDGVTGEKTWNMLFHTPDALEASATPRPTPVPTPVPYALTVDITNQVITAYALDENNEYTKVVRQMICSTGTRATPTGLGTFKLGASRSRFPLFPKYNCYVQYWTPIANGFGFHSVIYNTKNTKDLAVGSYNALGSRASHGCIRMLVDDAKWIYENAGKGTMVTITNKIPSDPELTQSLKPGALNWKTMLPKATPAPTPPPQYDSQGQPPTPFRALTRGSKGEDVYWLQMKLKELGYYTGTVTGGYYGGTQKAVKAFQKDYGIKTDGVAGAKTQSMIYRDVLPSPSPEVTPTPKPTPKP